MYYCTTVLRTMANICHSAIASSWYASYLSEIIIVHGGSMFGKILGDPFTHKFTFPQMHKNLTHIIRQTQTCYPLNLVQTNQQNFNNPRSLAPSNINDSTKLEKGYMKTQNSCLNVQAGVKLLCFKAKSNNQRANYAAASTYVKQLLLLLPAELKFWLMSVFS